MKRFFIKFKPLRQVFDKAVEFKVDRILKDQEAKHAKELKEKDEQYLQGMAALNSKHKLEIDRKDKQFSDSLERQRDDHDLKIKQLKEFYFISNSDAQDVQELYNDRLIRLNFLEKEFFSAASQLKHHNEHLIDVVKELLHEIIKTESQETTIVENFKKLYEAKKKKILDTQIRKKESIQEYLKKQLEFNKK